MTTQSKLDAQAEAQAILDEVLAQLDEWSNPLILTFSNKKAGQLAALLRSAARAEQSTAFHPEMGWLIDCASPSELAAYDQGCAESHAAVLAILDGKDTGVGVCNEPWASLRARLLALVAARAEASPDGRSYEEKSQDLHAKIRARGIEGLKECAEVEGQGGWKMVPVEPNEQWVLKFCELTNRDPAGIQGTFVEGRWLQRDFYEVAACELACALAAAPTPK